MFPSPGDLPNPGIEPRSPALQADSLPAGYQGSLFKVYLWTAARPLSLAGRRGLLFVSVHGLLIAAASRVVERGFPGTWAQSPWLPGSGAQAQ